LIAFSANNKSNAISNSEVQSHLDMLIAENTAGMSPRSARHAAKREFGAWS